MLQLCLKIKLLSDKSKEFIQCWQSFTQHTNGMEGVSYSIKENDKNNYELIFNFQEQIQLDRFVENEWFGFLMGGIQTLGKKCEKVTTEIDYK